MEALRLAAINPTYRERGEPKAYGGYELGSSEIHAGTENPGTQIPLAERLLPVKPLGVSSMP